MKQRYPAPLFNPDNRAARQEAYCKGLESLTDKGLQAEAHQKIWLSGYANNNPQSCYHRQADACYDEAKRRGKPKIYEAAYDAVLRELS